MQAIRVREFGGPEVLRLEDTVLPEPGPGEVRLALEVAGVNYIDTYHRTGLYKLPLPFTPGVEGIGTVKVVGPGVDTARVGDRVAYAMNPGSYAEEAIVPAWKAVPVPAGVPSAKAAAAMVQGLTAHYLTRSTFPLQKGSSALVHAAAGGTGQLIVQMAKMLGARVIGTVSTPEKAVIALEAGLDVAVNYMTGDFEAEVKSFTKGRGVDVVYDSVGKTTFEKSLRCLRPRGTLVLFGQSSGPVAPLDPQLLANLGSLYLTRPSLAAYAANRDELLWRAREVFAWIEAGDLNIRIDRSYPLARAGEAHVELEGRRTTGKIVLTVR